MHKYQKNKKYLIKNILEFINSNLKFKKYLIIQTENINQMYYLNTLYKYYLLAYFIEKFMKY